MEPLARVDLVRDERGIVLVSSLWDEDGTTQVELVLTRSERLWLVGQLLRSLAWST